jgi:microcystin-dependent protein
MGLCGCYPACACQLEAGNDLVSVTGTGDSTDPYVISGVETAFGLVNDDGGLIVTAGGPYGHTPHLNLRLEDSGTIALVVTPTGLRAELLNAPSGGGGVPTGAFFPYLGNLAPPGYLMMSGPNYDNYVPAVDHPALFALVGHMGSGGVDPGDGTFKVPSVEDMVVIGQGTLGPLGTTGGVMDVTLGASQIPNHGHGIFDPGHGHAGSTVSIASDGVHNHEPATARDSDFVTVDDPVTGADFVPVDIGGAGVRSTWVSIPTYNQPASPQQGNRAFTSNDGTHQHIGSTVSIAGAVTGVAVLNSTGGGGSHTNMQPYFVSNYIIKD